ncbi:MAG: hypothetical protein H0W73_02725 [Bacteroidetes bacterium]|nr:hypothetical protein [Bacteroidota bacterium]
MNNKLIRFWFKFENNPIPLNFGCGVTAFNDIDALTIIKEQVFKNKPFPEVAVKIENIDINTLDQGHIIPNMSPLQAMNSGISTLYCLKLLISLVFIM